MSYDDWRTSEEADDSDRPDTCTVCGDDLLPCEAHVCAVCDAIPDVDGDLEDCIL